MHRTKNTAWTIGVCLLFAVGIFGQTQRPTVIRSGDKPSIASRPVDPDSLGVSPTLAVGAQAIVPRLMKFSGALHDVAGKPLTGAVDVTFSLYNAEAGGTPLWYETQTVQADELGRYTALLGAMHTDGLPLDLFTSGEVRWLGIQVGMEAEQEPRVLLVSVPYALKAGDAETLGGKPASAYMLSDAQGGTTLAVSPSASATAAPQTNISSRKQKSQTTNNSVATPCTSVTSDGTAALNSIALFTTSCNIQSSNLVQFNGNLGFGISTPQAELHIFGPDISDSNARFNFILGDSTPAAAGVGGGILFSGYYNGTTAKAGFANIRGVKENSIQGNYASALIFDTRLNGGGETERMRITSGGLVGIGTTAPAHTLDVVGDIRSFLGMNVDGLGVNNGALADGLTFGISSGEGIASKRTSGGNQYGLDFYTQFANRMSIRQSGQVGIGTSNPYTSLHIRGDVAGGLGPTLLLMNGGAGGNAGASIDFDGYDPGGANLPSARMQSYDDGNFSSHLTFQTKVPGASTNALVEQVRISSHGSLIVDSSAQNGGGLSDGSAAGTGLVLGGTGSGEGMASCRGGCLGLFFGNRLLNDQYGLNFFTNDTLRMMIANDGSVGIYGCTSWSNGDLQGPCPSDARLKSNIQSLSPVLDKLALLRPVQFNYRTVEYPQYHLPSVRMTGLIAQEVEKVFPELVSTDARGFRTLDSGPLRFMLLEGVRELKTRNDSLRQQVGEQQAQLRQAREENRAQQVEIQKLSGQVLELKQEQTEIAALKARLDRLEKGESTTQRAQGPHPPKGKPSGSTQVARARF